jgi:hypothetical protein
MGAGKEWYLSQGLIGIAAGASLAALAAAEVRQRLAKVSPPAAPPDRGERTTGTV